MIANLTVHLTNIALWKRFIMYELGVCPISQLSPLIPSLVCALAIVSCRHWAQCWMSYSGCCRQPVSCRRVVSSFWAISRLSSPRARSISVPVYQARFRLAIARFSELLAQRDAPSTSYAVYVTTGDRDSVSIVAEIRATTTTSIHIHHHRRRHHHYYHYHLRSGSPYCSFSAYSSAIGLDTSRRQRTTLDLRSWSTERCLPRALGSPLVRARPHVRRALSSAPIHPWPTDTSKGWCSMVLSGFPFLPLFFYFLY